MIINNKIGDVYISPNKQGLYVITNRTSKGYVKLSSIVYGPYWHLKVPLLDRKYIYEEFYTNASKMNLVYIGKFNKELIEYILLLYHDTNILKENKSFKNKVSKNISKLLSKYKFLRKIIKPWWFRIYYVKGR